jgi:hypothetical protein
MLPHFGQVWICPIAVMLRTLSRARHVVQQMEKRLGSTAWPAGFEGPGVANAHNPSQF